MVTGKTSKQTKGRKRTSESRAIEIRWRLVAWKQLPEPRPSLRWLAMELGTSHQLLSHFLKGLDEWAAREQAESYRREAQEIREKIAADPHSITYLHERLAVCEREIDRQSARERLAQLQAPWIQDLERRARKGLLDPLVVKFLPQLVGELETRRILRLQAKAESRLSEPAKRVLRQ